MHLVNILRIITFNCLEGHSNFNNSDFNSFRVFWDTFQFNNERHDTYNLRNGDTDLAPPMPKKEFGKRCFSYNGALHWNNLPHEAKILKLEWHESLSSFKSILKQRMS